jgi:hypothetical protein
MTTKEIVEEVKELLKIGEFSAEEYRIIINKLLDKICELSGGL